VVAGYRERKILKRFRVAPISPVGFLGSWLLTLVSTLSIGMMVGGIAKNEKMASVIACLLYFPMLFFSGTRLPFEVMPEIMQRIVAFFPLIQGIQLMKAASLGMHTESIWMPAAVMGTVTILCTGVAVKCFKWE
jgi:ABC-2 type transport system permease protein